MERKRKKDEERETTRFQKEKEDEEHERVAVGFKAQGKCRIKNDPSRMEFKDKYGRNVMTRLDFIHFYSKDNISLVIDESHPWLKNSWLGRLHKDS